MGGGVSGLGVVVIGWDVGKSEGETQMRRSEGKGGGGRPTSN